MLRKMRWLLLFLIFPANFVTAQIPSPALLVLEKNDKSMAIVDPGTLKVVARVPAGEDPHEIVASDDGRFAYISNYGAFQAPQHTISIADLSTQKTAPAVDLGALRAPHGLEFVNGKVYFTAEGSKVIGRYDPATHAVDWTLGIGQNRTHMLVVSRDESRIFTANVNSDTISILDRDKSGDASGWIETPISVGKGPEGFDVSPDEKELWAANSHDGTVSVVELTNRKVVQTIEVHTKRANRVKFTPDGKLVLISDLDTGDLVVVEAASRKEVKRMTLGRGVAGILIVPDGSTAYIAVSTDSQVAVVDLKTLSVTGRIATGKGPDGMAWALRK
ncbi:MAG TPA: YncE family protein [Candidatus Sulfotelmatobacter sp.]|nr:YncE family protein [Candidatus Sulfotelmatobacter sp.]